MDKNEWHRIFCEDGRCVKYKPPLLGALDLSRESSVQFYCNKCKKLFKYEVKAGGIIYKSIVPRNQKHCNYRDLMIIKC